MTRQPEIVPKRGAQRVLQKDAASEVEGFVGVAELIGKHARDVENAGAAGRKLQRPAV